MAGWIFFGSIVVLIVDGFIASEFRHTAAEKGYDESKYFWWSFLLGVVGWLMVIALPDRGQTVTVKPVEKPAEDEIPDL